MLETRGSGGKIAFEHVSESSVKPGLYFVAVHRRFKALQSLALT